MRGTARLPLLALSAFFVQCLICMQCNNSALKQAVQCTALSSDFSDFNFKASATLLNTLLFPCAGYNKRRSPSRVEVNAVSSFRFVSFGLFSQFCYLPSPPPPEQRCCFRQINKRGRTKFSSKQRQRALPRSTMQSFLVFFVVPFFVPER